MLFKRKQILVDFHKLLHRVQSAFPGIRKGNICLKWVTVIQMAELFATFDNLVSRLQKNTA